MFKQKHAKPPFEKGWFYHFSSPHVGYFLTHKRGPQRGFDLVIISFKSSSMIRYDSHENTWKAARIEQKKKKKSRAALIW